MTTFTRAVDDRIAALIRRVAAQEKKEEATVATERLEWSATERGTTDAPTPETVCIRWIVLS